MKKLLAVVLCLVLAMAVVGCGKEDKKEENDIKVQTQDNQKNEDKAEVEEKTEEGNTEEKAEKEPKVEAPVIESSEELEDIVGEFNTTDDPERKEELRQQLEALFEQAEMMTAGE